MTVPTPFTRYVVPEHCLISSYYILGSTAEYVSVVHGASSKRRTIIENIVPFRSVLGQTFFKSFILTPKFENFFFSLCCFTFACPVRNRVLGLVVSHGIIFFCTHSFI